MEDTDYLKVLRGVMNVASKRLLQEVCDEAADLFPVHGRQGHTVRAAFDLLCDAVGESWEQKKSTRENEQRAKNPS